MSNTDADSPVMWVPSMDVHLCRWFSNYQDAWEAREAEGGYLFPYKHHFFVTEADAIRELGLDPEDPDWELIGWDWVHPLESEAWERLKDKRELAV